MHEQQFVDILGVGSLQMIYSHSIFFTYIILSWKHKYKQTFAIVFLVIVTNSEQRIRVFPRDKYSRQFLRSLVQAHSCGYVAELITKCNQIIAVPKAKVILHRLR